MSIKPCRQYFLQLAQLQISFYGVITGVTLKNEKNKGGITYSQAQFRSVRLLEDKEILQVSKAIHALKSIFSKETIIEAEVQPEQ